MSWQYTPILQWKKSQQVALSTLSSEIKDKVKPLLLMTPPGYDWNLNKPLKTLEKQTEQFVKMYLRHWPTNRAYIDTGLLEDDNFYTLKNGDFPLQSIFNQFSQYDVFPVPVISLLAPPKMVCMVKSIIEHHNLTNICIRIDYADHMFDLLIGDNLKKMIEHLGIAVSNVDVLVDLKQPDSFKPINDLAKILKGFLDRIVAVNQHLSSIIISSTAFPQTMAGIKAPHGVIDRDDWELYLETVNLLPQESNIFFGDYAISRIDHLSDEKLLMIKPKNTIKYTCAHTWFVVKGNKSSREPKGNLEYREMTQYLVKKGDIFHGKDFSPGCHYLYSHSIGEEGPGNQQKFLQVGINQHITMTVKELAKKSGF